MAAWILLRISYLVIVELFNGPRYAAPAYFFLLLCCRGPRFTGLYRNMEITRERISFIFDPSDISDMLLSLRIGFSFARAALACAIIERISGFSQLLKQLLQFTWKIVTVPSFCSFNPVSLSMSLALFVITFVFPALISILNKFVSWRCLKRKVE